MSNKSKKKKRMQAKIDARFNKKRKPRKVHPCIEVEVKEPRTKKFGSSMGLAIAEARRNKQQ